MNSTLAQLTTNNLETKFLDQNWQDFDGDTLFVVAPMLAEINNPAEMVEVALRFLTTRLDAGRCDVGTGKQGDKEFVATVDFRRDGEQMPRIAGLALPNRHPVFQRVWGSAKPVPYDDIENNPLLADIKQDFESVGSKSMLAQRLEFQDEIFGLVCIDDLDRGRTWTAEEQAFFNEFNTKFLAPLIFLSQKLTEKRTEEKPSPAELDAVRLSAKGYSYKQIASSLEKSERTIESQLRNARVKTGAANQVELIKFCTPWL
ncbi:MAG: LuxR C-terminal-related transcriptional regulator [Pseudomonadota bacterium]